MRVFDGERLLSDRNVLFDGGTIVQIDGGRLKAEGAEVIEGEGKTLIPGFIDSHVHIGEDVKGALAQCLSFGVTTVLDMFNNGERFQTIESDSIRKIRQTWRTCARLGSGLPQLCQSSGYLALNNG